MWRPSAQAVCAHRSGRHVPERYGGTAVRMAQGEDIMHTQKGAVHTVRMCHRNMTFQGRKPQMRCKRRYVCGPQRYRNYAAETGAETGTHVRKNVGKNSSRKIPICPSDGKSAWKTGWTNWNFYALLTWTLSPRRPENRDFSAPKTPRIRARLRGEIQKVQIVQIKPQKNPPFGPAPLRS